MSEEQQELLPENEFSELGIGEAAVRRYYQDVGARADLLKRQLARLAQSGHFVVGMNIKWPSENNPGFLVVVRAVHEEGPVVAFHGADQLLETMLGFGGRVRSGQVVWRKDEFAADGWVERLAWLHTRQTYL